MEVSEPLRAYAEEKIARVKKYIEEPIEAQVVFSVEKKIRHSAEVVIYARGVTIKGSEETNDMYAAIDAVVDKIERQLKRYKEKLKMHKPANGRERRVEKSVVTAESVESGQTPTIVRSQSFEVKPMSVEEAVMQMDLMHKDFFIFTDDRTAEINVVYRRKDGNYGLIVPQAK